MTDPIHEAIDRLTPRQLEVVGLLACGRGWVGAGLALGLSPHTARGHIRKALRVTGAVNARHLVAMAAIAGALNREHVAVAVVPTDQARPPGWKRPEGCR